MPHCCAFGCPNNEKKGLKLYRLPSGERNEQRRNIWLQKIARIKWNPTNNCKLCEVHFTSDQFENHRADNRRLLKPNAVPSVFSHRRIPKSRKTSKYMTRSAKGLQKDAKQDDKFSPDAGPSVDVESDTNLLLTAAASDMIVELDPTTFVPSDSEEPDPPDPCEAGPSSRVEPDSSMMEDEHLAMTCEVYPVKTEPDSPSMDIRIKEEPEDTFKPDILSATVERELYHFSKDTPAAISDEDSLFQPPVLIKEEPVSSEEDP